MRSSRGTCSRVASCNMRSLKYIQLMSLSRYGNSFFFCAILNLSIVLAKKRNLCYNTVAIPKKLHDNYKISSPETGHFPPFLSVRGRPPFRPTTEREVAGDGKEGVPAVSPKRPEAMSGKSGNVFLPIGFINISTKYHAKIFCF